MEITRQPVISISQSSELAASASSERSTGVPVAPISAPAPVKPGLERIQSALVQLPQVDLGKVAQLKAAIAAGELSSDSATLAGAMLTYHRGER